MTFPKSIERKNLVLNFVCSSSKLHVLLHRADDCCWMERCVFDFHLDW